MDTAPQASVDELTFVKAQLAVAKARNAEDKALIAHQALRIAKLERQIYGPRKERHAQPIEQMEYDLEELDIAASEAELLAEMAIAATTGGAPFTCKRPEPRTTFPEHLPRERVVIDPPTTCECCGGKRLRKLGEDVTQTLEPIPRRRKVIQTVRGEKPVVVSPVALEVVRQIGALFEIERKINGQAPDDRRDVRQALSKPKIRLDPTHLRRRQPQQVTHGSASSNSQ
jgi:hypothetical protein